MEPLPKVFATVGVLAGKRKGNGPEKANMVIFIAHFIKMNKIFNKVRDLVEAGISLFSFLAQQTQLHESPALRQAAITESIEPPCRGEKAKWATKIASAKNLTIQNF